jgi:hypothetical protein
MTTASRVALFAMLGSLMGFTGGSTWGVFYGFPSPDAGAEESARLQFHANVAGSILLLAFFSHRIERIPPDAVASDVEPRSLLSF